MREWFGKLLYGFIEVWRNIGISQRVSIVGILMLSMAAMGGIIYVGSKPDFVVLYSNMNSEASQKVFEIVEGEGIPFKIADEGRTIKVPRQYASTLKGRVRATGVDINDAPKGWKLFDKSELGMSQEQLRIKKQRAIQGELTKMIAVIPGVKNAKIELATPPRRAFYRKGAQKQATASVLVVMHPGKLLTPAQVTTIRHQVSGAVDDLMPENVTISDNYGRLLARRRSGAFGGDVNSQLEVKEQIEMALQEKAEACLRPFVGANNVVAMVTAEIDFDKTEIVSEKFTGPAVVISEKISSEDSSKSGGNSASGKAGFSGNSPGQTSVNVGTGKETTASIDNKSTDTTSLTESQYAIPKSTEHKNHHGPKVMGMSVAVSILRVDDTPLSEADKTNYSQHIATALGTKVENVSVYAQKGLILAPDVAGVPILDKVTDQVETLTGSPLIRVVVGVLLFGLAWKIFKKQFTAMASSEPEAQSGIFGEDLYLAGQQAAAGEIVSEATPTTPYDVVASHATQNPEELAQAIESWLKRSNGK